MQLGETPTTPEQYSSVVEALNSRRRLDTVLEQDWAKAQFDALANAKVRCFHWELEFPGVFLDHEGNGRATGFNVIIGNPPYDVLSEREIGRDISHIQSYIRNDDTLAPSLVHKNNLYKIFICRAVELLADGGQLGFIVPMSLLGDEQAKGIREHLFSTGELRQIHAFPQKDNPLRRVFRDAKLSTTVFVYQRLSPGNRTNKPFRSQIHPAQYIEDDSPAVDLDTNSVKLYDPRNLTIVSCSQNDWDLAVSISKSEVARLGSFANFFQGEVNETNTRRAGLLVDADNGQLVTRGASICTYALRQASQGNDLFLNVPGFLDGKRPDTKAFHHRLERVGLQESSPQNNFRRIIACRIPVGEFCNHTINYTTSAHNLITLELVLAVLNSTFADWYFRLGSTNAHVSHYQLKNIPCPRFNQDGKAKADAVVVAKVEDYLNKDALDDLQNDLTAELGKEGVIATSQQIIIRLVRYIEAEERKRGEIARAERSHLSENGERAQHILDDLIFKLLGIAHKEQQHIRERLAEML